MATTRFDTKIIAPHFRVKRGATNVESGLMVQYVAFALYDTAGNDSAGVSNKTVAAHGTGVFLPLGAILTNAWTDVKTTFTSSTSAATIALKVQTANDIVSAIALNSGSSRWASGLGGTVLGTQALDGNALTAINAAAANAAAMIKLTAEREIVATVAVEALTAGKMGIYVEYYIGL